MAKDQTIKFTKNKYVKKQLEEMARELLGFERGFRGDRKTKRCESHFV